MSKDTEKNTLERRVRYIFVALFYMFFASWTLLIGIRSPLEAILFPLVPTLFAFGLMSFFSILQEATLNRWLGLGWTNRVSDIATFRTAVLELLRDRRFVITDDSLSTEVFGIAAIPSDDSSHLHCIQLLATGRRDDLSWQVSIQLLCQNADWRFFLPVHILRRRKILRELASKIIVLITSDLEPHRNQ